MNRESVRPPNNKIVMWSKGVFGSNDILCFQHVNWAYDVLGVPFKVATSFVMPTTDDVGFVVEACQMVCAKEGLKLEDEPNNQKKGW